jgi:hypothetical protein
MDAVRRDGDLSALRLDVRHRGLTAEARIAQRRRHEPLAMAVRACRAHDWPTAPPVYTATGSLAAAQAASDDMAAAVSGKASPRGPDGLSRGPQPRLSLMRP